MTNKPKTPNNGPEWTQTPEFESLQKEWYGKLKESGFEDIEWKEGLLRGGSLDTRFGIKGLQFNLTNAEIIEYYDLAERFLSEYEFKNQYESTIWDHYSQGRSIREISDILIKNPTKKVRGQAKNKSRVGEIVKRLSTIMLKRYINKGPNDVD